MLLATKFQILTHKIDTIILGINKLDSCICYPHKNDTIPIIINNNIPNNGSGDDSILKWLLQYLLFPIIIGVITLGVGIILNKRKSKSRIKSLAALIDTWIVKTLSALKEQVRVFERIKENYTDIDKEQDQAPFVDLDIKRLLNINNEDLYNIFVFTRSGKTNDNWDKFYDLLINLKMADTIVDDYRNNSRKLREHIIDVSDEGLLKYDLLKKKEEEVNLFFLNQVTYIDSLPAGDLKVQESNKLLSNKKILEDYSKLVKEFYEVTKVNPGRANYKKTLLAYTVNKLNFLHKNLRAAEQINIFYPVLKALEDLEIAINAFDLTYKRSFRQYEIKVKQLNHCIEKIESGKRIFENLKFKSLFYFPG